MMKITPKQVKKFTVLSESFVPTVMRTATASCLTMAKHTAVCSLSLSTVSTAIISKKRYCPATENCMSKSRKSTN